ncbi:MAG: ABC transporter ATP-binding protein [Thermaurantiacus tibetensis]|uniref:ABC transporter ATP-binding protein n=1 Tax=Thermaurantiacus tibetensis TaxID=2759035 RepID=UPI00188E17BB|nr:ABC transporter ATP-binding protein [Thermaurantiacus tibetensis]
MAEPGLAVALRASTPIPLDLAFAVAPGELVALVGPSGAGKSSVLRSIAGLHHPAETRVTCAGEIWADSAAGLNLPPHRRRVGLLFQAYALFPHLSARANVEAAMGHLPRSERRARAEALLALVHLEGLGARKPHQLSGGQQQRVALARALAREPAVLLLDEPFSAVDRRTRRALIAELQALRASIRVPTLLVTHDLDEARALADRLLVLDGGRLLQEGPPEAVLAAPASEAVRAALDLPAQPDGGSGFSRPRSPSAAGPAAASRVATSAR